MPRFATVILVDHRGWLLLQERDEHAPIAPEQWGMAGGHVEDGEEVEAAAYRELLEETGVVLERGTLEHFADYQVFHEVYDSTDLVRVFVAPTALTDEDIVLGEGRRIVFVEPGAARALDLTDSAALAVPALLDSDVYRKLVSP